ncbi:MAG: Maf family protein [Eubacterium sp.]
MIILASKSPRRQELLKLITEDFVVKSASVDEALPSGIEPCEAVLYLSRIKAEPFKSENDIVIGADTVVALGNEILGKPENDEDAARMLKMLSGKEHNVFTGVTVSKNGKSRSFYEKTAVKFFDLTNDEINAYVATGECSDKAGAYGIQGKGSLLVEKITGDYFNVVGLPVARLYRELIF